MRASQRPRRTQMRQTEPPKPRTIEEAMRGTDPRSGYSRADQSLAERRGGEMLLSPLSTLIDEAKRTGALERGTPLSYGLSTAAFLGDFFNPSVDIPVAAGIRGVGKAAEGVRRARDPIENLIKLDLDPATTARMLALDNRLFHGKQGTRGGKFVGSNESAPTSFDVLPDAPRQFQNWFDGDFFTTPSETLARTYGDPYLVPSVPDNLRVLDLMPGGRSIADQSPELASMLRRVFGPEDAASSFDRHKPYTEAVLGNLNDPEAVGSMSKILRDYGYNALRHVSGRGAGRGSGLEEAVYVFFGPEGMKATSQIGGPVARTMGKAAEKINAPIKRAKQASQRTYQNAMQDYQQAERANRLEKLGRWANQPGFPLPPGYQPLPAPPEPGAFDFLRFLFAR